MDNIPITECETYAEASSDRAYIVAHHTRFFNFHSRSDEFLFSHEVRMSYHSCVSMETPLEWKLYDVSAMNNKVPYRRAVVVSLYFQ